MSRVLKDAFGSLMIKDVPAYANKFFYSLGFLSMISFIVLLVTGIVMTFYGPDWWLTSTFGSYIRSVHLWATQAFVVFVILHLLIVFFTSGFKKPRRLTWVFGVSMFILVILQSEFGYLLRNDFSSQWRTLQGADFYNGTGLGYWINTLNTKQMYGIHVAVIPFMLLGLLAMHYLLVRVLGIAKPYRKDIEVKTVEANHALLFMRGGGLVILIMLLAWLLPSPFIKATTITSIAQQDPALVAQTLIKEYDYSSDTATYTDNIAPYTYDTRLTYVTTPYGKLIATNTKLIDQSKSLYALPAATQSRLVSDAASFYENWDGNAKVPVTNPFAQMIGQLTVLAASGLYAPAIAADNAIATPSDDSTYVLRFLSDTGALEEHATSIKLATEQYGMLHEESGKTPGAWWLAPVGVLNHTVLNGDENGDRDAAIIFGIFFLVLYAFPFIPYFNRIPDWLKVYKLIWRVKK